MQDSILLSSKDYPPITKPIPVSISMEAVRDEKKLLYFATNENLGLQATIMTSYRDTRLHRWLNLRRLRAELLVDLDFMTGVYLLHPETPMDKYLRSRVDALREHVNPALRQGPPWVIEQ